jgi:hypothetical protein
MDSRGLEVTVNAMSSGPCHSLGMKPRLRCRDRFRLRWRLGERGLEGDERPRQAAQMRGATAFDADPVGPK